MFWFVMLVLAIVLTFVVGVIVCYERRWRVVVSPTKKQQVVIELRKGSHSHGVVVGEVDANSAQAIGPMMTEALKMREVLNDQAMHPCRFRRIRKEMALPGPTGATGPTGPRRGGADGV